MTAAEQPNTPGQNAPDPNDPDQTPIVAPDRRAVLRGFSLAGLAAVAAPKDPITDLINSLTGGGSEPPAPAPPPEPTPAPAPEPTPEPKPKNNKKNPPKKGDLVRDGDTPIASTEDIPVNSGALFEADEYVITQPKSGQFLGYDSLCTHEGCPVDSFDTPGQMNCSCHGAKFDIKNGKVIDGPAKKPMPKKPIIVENGKIYKAKKAK